MSESASSPIVANSSGVVIGPDGKRLYGMDAELHLKREAQRDPEFEKRIGEWISSVIASPLADPEDLYVSLRSGVVLCELVNAIVPDSIKRYAKTKLLPLMEMDNIQLYLKACWNMGVPSGDFFIVSDLYQKKSMPQVIQNLVSLSRVAAALGVGEPIVAGNSNKDRVKNWEPVASGGAAVRVEDLEAGTPAERITQLSVALGEAQHALDTSRSDNHNLQATMKELKEKHRSERERWTAEKETLEKRLQKFAPIDDGGEGAPGSQAVQALELHYKNETDALRAELAAERERYAALEKRFQDVKSKQSQTALELSKLRMEQKKNGGSGGSDAPAPSKPSWMSKVQARKQQSHVRAPSIRIVKPQGAVSGGVSRPQSMAIDGSLIEGANYRLSTMLQLKSTGGEGGDKDKTGFFFSADDLGEEGVSYLSEQLDVLFSNSAIEEDASTILNEMLLVDTGRRGFTFLLKQKLRDLNFQKIKLDPGPFITLLSLVNSALTGMQLEGGRVDYIALTFLLGASRAVYTTGSRSQMEEHLADHLRDHSIWADVNFWEQHFWDVLPKSFKKKFAGATLAEAQDKGYADDQLKFLSQFIASFAHEMGRWSVTPEGMNDFFKRIFERLTLPEKYQNASRSYYDKLVAREAAKNIQDSSKLKHVSLVMSSAQMARLNGALAGAMGPGAPKKVESDANILQGWVKRKVHIMWITEWVSQTGTNLVFREFKTSLQKRVTLNLDKITKVEIRKDSSLKDSRVIFVEAGDMKVTLAPVKDTDEEVNYWLSGLQRMQKRFNVAPGTVRSSPLAVRRVEEPKKADKSTEDTKSGSPSSPVKPGLLASSPPALKAGLSSIQSNSPTKPTGGGFARASPQPGMERSSSFTAANLEGWMQLNVTKEVAKKIGKGQRAGWHPFWFVQEVSKLHLHRAQRDDESLYTIDLSDISQLESTSDPEVTGEVLRLHSSTAVYNLCPNDKTFDYWKNGLAACKKRFATRLSFSAGSQRASVSAPKAATATPDVPEGKLEGWVQFRGNLGAAVASSSSKSLFGTLKKLGQSKWTPLWLSLSGSTLSMFRSQEDVQLVHELDLTQLTEVEETNDREMFGRVFKLVLANGETPFLSPKEGEEAAWHDRLKALARGSSASSISSSSSSLNQTRSSSGTVGSSPSLGRSSVFSNLLLGRGSSASPKKDVVERAIPAEGEALSGWAHVDEGRRWVRAWLAQKGTILEQRTSPEEDAKLVQAMDLTRLTKSEAVTGPDAYGPAVLCTIDGKEILFAPERGHHNYWVTGMERVLARYNAPLMSPAEVRKSVMETEKKSNTGGGGAAAAAAATSDAPAFSKGASVWAQYSDDSLWYRAVVTNVGSGNVYEVKFSESDMIQANCKLSSLRPLDDPAMLALAGSTAEELAPSADTIDRSRPVSVQLPSNLAAVLRDASTTGSFVKISADEALKSREEEERREAELEAKARQEMEAEIAQRKAEEARIRKEKLRQAKLKKEARLAAEAEAEAERKKKQEEEAAEAARRRAAEEEEAQLQKEIEEEERLLKEEQQRALEEEEAKLQQEIAEEERKLEEERKRLEKEEEEARLQHEKAEKERKLEEERKRREKDEKEKAAAAAAAAAAAEEEERRLAALEEATLQQEKEEAEKQAAAERAKKEKEEQDRIKAEKVEMARQKAAALLEKAAQRKEEPDSTASSDAADSSMSAPAPTTSRSAAVQAALARARARTSAIKSQTSSTRSSLRSDGGSEASADGTEEGTGNADEDDPILAKRKPLPDPFA